MVDSTIADDVVRGRSSPRVLDRPRFFKKMGIRKTFRETTAAEIVIARELGMTPQKYRACKNANKFTKEQRRAVKYLEKEFGFLNKAEYKRKQMLIRGQVIRAEEVIALRLPLLLDKAFELVEGVTVKETNSDGEDRIYTKPPDKEMIKYLTDRAMGPIGKTKFIEDQSPQQTNNIRVQILLPDNGRLKLSNTQKALPPGDDDVIDAEFEEYAD